MLLEDIYNWKTTGNLHIWKYKEANKNYAGVHIATNKPSAKAIMFLLDGISKQSSSLRKTIELSNVDKELLCSTGYNSSGEIYQKLRINFKKNSSDLLKEKIDGEVLIFEISQDPLRKLAQGFKRVSEGSDDFKLYIIDKKVHKDGFWFWLHNE